MLLVGAALLIRTFDRARARSNPGFDSHNVLTMRMSLTGPRYAKAARRRAADPRRRRAAARAARRRRRSSATCCVPLEGGYGLPFDIVGRPLDRRAVPRRRRLDARSRRATSTCSRSRCCAAATFTDRDAGRRRRVVIINEAMAKQFWPNGDPLSDRIVIGKGVDAGVRGRSRAQIVGDRRRRPRRRAQPAIRSRRCTSRRRRCPTASTRSTSRLTPIGVGRAHARRAARAERGDPEAAAPGERRAAGVATSSRWTRSSSRSTSRPRLQHAADDGVRRRGAAAGGDRHLRADGVLGRAADAGDRHPPGARRASSARCGTWWSCRGCAWRSSAS